MSGESSLFIGFPVGCDYAALLASVPAARCARFIQNGPDYLQRIEEGEKVYLGKKIDGAIDLNDLESVGNNIYSLLRCMISQYPYESHPLLLIATQVKNP